MRRENITPIMSERRENITECIDISRIIKY